MTAAARADDHHRTSGRSVLALLALLAAVLSGLVLTGPRAAWAEVESSGSATYRQPAARMTTGKFHTCVIVGTGGVKCWGANNEGQLGLGSVADFGDTPDETPATGGSVPLPAGRHAVSIAAGREHTCAVLDDGNLRCWGYNIVGQLGRGTTLNYGNDPGETPALGGTVSLPAGTKAVAVAAGALHTCVLLDTGGVRCWGYNFDGQLGLGHTGTYGDQPGETPASGGAVPLPAGTKAVSLTAGGYHTCALLDTGQVRCWGDNEYGQLGLGSTSDWGDVAGEWPASGGGLSLPAGTSATAISAGEYYTCAILSTGALRCWGMNGGGELGQGTGSSAPYGDSPGETPASGGEVQLPAGSRALAITTGYHSACVLLDTRELRCWGHNWAGTLGFGGGVSYYGDTAGETPAAGGLVTMPPGTFAVATSIGIAHTCAVLSTGSLRCWGYNNKGQLGLGHQGTFSDDFDELPSTGGAVDLGPGVTISVPADLATYATPTPPAPTATPPAATPSVSVPGTTGTGPGTVRALKVTGQPGARTRGVSWRPPAGVGSSAAPIASYQVIVRATVDGRNRVIWRKVLPAGSSSSSVKVTLRRSRLASGRHVVRVRARTGSGASGSWSSARFVVAPR